MVEKLLEVNGLKTYYYSSEGVTPAVDGVSFSLGRGEVLGIVGESGCGKSTVARSVVGLVDKSFAKIEAGNVLYRGQDLSKISKKELCGIRGEKISMIFQDPFVSLNPVYTVENQIYEVLRVHKKISKAKARPIILNLMRRVGIPSPENRMKDYPYQLSGGMQQRIMIAIALACNPDILIADEPTTALDVTVQAQVLELINDLKEEFQMSIMLISHNMGVIAAMCDRIMIMYGGVAVEEGTGEAVFSRPLHPYTKGLLASIPSIAGDKEELYSIKGTVPTLSLPIVRCRFADRCDEATEHCLRGAEPPLRDLGNGRKVRCWNVGDTTC